MLPRVKSFVVNEGLKHVLWIAWLGINSILFYYTFMYYYTGPQFYYLHQMLGYGLCISRASAACINLNSSVLLLPMCKRLFTYLRGMKFLMGRQARRLLDRGRSFHIYCGYLLCLLAAIHCGAHGYNAVYFSKYYNPKYKELNVAKYANQNPLIMLVTSLAGITGLLLVFSLLVIAIFASRPVRQNRHDRFWATHHLFMLFYVLLFIHALDGVIKYQSNLDEHTPGCFVVVDDNITSSSTKSMVIPEPEPVPHPEPMSLKKNKMAKRHAVDVDDKTKAMLPSNEKDVSEKTKQLMKKKKMKALPNKSLSHQMVMPEPEPMPIEGSAERFVHPNDSMVSRLYVNGSWVYVKACNQPRPIFASCPKEVWMWLCFPLFLYIVERLTRFYKASYVAVKVEGFEEHPSNVIEIRMSQKNFKAKPGQSIWLRCPEISRVELHPFSLTSVPCETDPTFGIHIKVVGDWTTELRKRLIDCHKQDFQITGVNHKYVSSNLPEVQEEEVAQCNRDDMHGALHQSECFVLKESCVEEKSMEFAVDNAIPLHTNLETRNADDHKEVPPGVSIETRSCSFTSRVKDSRKERSQNSKDHEQPRQIMSSLFVEGPTGSAMEDIYKYKISLCVAGGIGVTPFASVLNSLLKSDRLLHKMKLQRLYLTWICRSVESFEWFANLIEEVQIKFWQRNLPDFLNVHLYVTGRNEPDTEANSSSIQLIKNSPLKRCKLSLMRPNITDVLQNIAERHPKSTVGVFCCGPRSLIATTKDKCLKVPCKSQVKFIFNKESF